MLITERSKKTIDACRFCWMCRHICPIGNVTGQERNNARGRALTLSLVERGTPLSVDIMGNVYECALCGACTKECVTGFDPVEFTKAVRLEGAINGVMPDYINELIVNIEETGNPYGENKLDGELEKAIDSLPKSADTLLFLGVDARYKASSQATKAIELLKKAGIDFTVLKDEPDSGYMMDTLLGGAQETQDIMKNAIGILNRYKTIIAYDPSDAKVFLREYKEWDLGLEPKVKTFTAYLAALIENKNIKLKKIAKTLTFQDPAHLARDLEETDGARVILNACANVKEMLLWGKDTMWAGNLLMNTYMPHVMTLTAQERWKNALATGADVLVTASPSEYVLLEQTKPAGIELMTIEQVVSGGLE